MSKIKRIFLMLIATFGLVFITSCQLFATGYTVVYETYGLSNVPNELNAIQLPYELPKPTAKGYEFLGWYYDEAFIVEAYGGDLIVDDTTLYASWNRLSYTITFENTKGEKVEPLKKVTTITNLPDVQVEGYEFLGWYYDSEFKNAVKINDEIFEDTTVYAKWDELKYSISFNKNGHGEDLNPVENCLEIPTDLPTLEAEGYKFLGWYTDFDLTIIATPGTKISSNITLFAKWQELYDVTYNNNGRGDQVKKVSNVETLPTLPTLKAEGYTFVGWYYDEEFKTLAKSNDVLNKDVTLYAKWDEDEYTVKFDLNGATGTIADKKVKYSLEFDIPTCDVKYKGYTFVEWNTKADGSGDSYLEQSEVKSLTTKESITLYAIWDEVEYTLTIQLNNGQDNIIHKLNYNDALPSIENPSKANSEFAGWFTYVDGKEVEFDFNSKMPDSNITIYAKYHGEVNVVFTINGEVHQTLTGIKTEEITTLVKEPEITGYTFVAWYMDSDYETPYNLTTYPNEDVTVYGKIKANTITVIFNANGGTGTMANQTITYDSGTPLTLNKFTRTGYKFIGWSLDEDKNTVDYIDGYSKDVVSKGSVTLYAVWEVISCNVTYVTNGHGEQPAVLKGVYKLPSTLPELIEEKYIFEGWYYDQSFTNKANANDLINSNTTLYAKWEEEKILTPGPTEKIVDNIIYDDFQIHFLELGNRYAGDSIYIKAGENDILIDAGSKEESAVTIKNYIDKYCTDGKLEYLIVTHGDKDHIAGLVGKNSNGILYKYQVGTFIDSASPKSTDLYKNYVTLRNNAVSNGAVYYTAAQCFNNTDGAKSTFNLGVGMSFTILYNYYYENPSSSNENNNSVCMMFTYNDFNFMFTGDLEESGEKKLVSYYNGSTPAKTLPEVELFKAGHHGSKTSTNTDLLKLIKPEIVCVTCCAGGSEYTNNYKETFPTQGMIDRVAEYTERVYVTTMYDVNNKTYGSLNGDIIISSNGAHVGVSATNNITKLKDSEWFNTTIYAIGDAYCSGKGKTDFYTAATAGAEAKPQRVWPS